MAMFIIYKTTETHRFASVRATLMVSLYPDRLRLKPSISSSPRYRNLAQSRKLVRSADRDEYLTISCSNSLHALPQRRSGSSSADRLSSVVVSNSSWSGARTSLKASSSSIRSRTRFV